MEFFEKSEVVAQAIMDSVVDQYETVGHDLPARQFLGYAGMPIDCDMLSVFASRMYQVSQSVGPESEAIAAQRCVYWGGAEVDILLVRCTPQPTATNNGITLVMPSVIERFSKLQMADPHIIARGVLRAYEAGTLGLGANLAFMDSALVGDESGMLIGIRLRVRVGLVI